MKLACSLAFALLLGNEVNAAAQVFVAPPPPPVSMPDIIWNSHVIRQLGTNAAGQAVFSEQLKRDLEKKSAGTGTAKPVDRPSATPSYSSALSYPYSGIVMSYMTYNGVRELDASRSVAIYRQASRLFLDNPEFAKFSATDKQTLAEVLVAVGGMPGLTFKTTRDSAQMKKVAGSTLVKLFGKEGASVKITENGIEF